jgi:hypothetical protein
VAQSDNQSDSPAAVAASTHGVDSRLRRWARRRGRQLLWLLGFVAVAAVVAAVTILLSRASRLIGLPDIGDPFDVAAFEAFRIPEDEDAAVLIRQAAAMTTRTPVLSGRFRTKPAPVPWSKVDPALQKWLEENRAALGVFRQATLRPDCLLNRTGRDGDNPHDLKIGAFCYLAMLEASRLEDQGDMEAAWGWYQAVLRLRVLIMRRGSVFQRMGIDAASEELPTRLETWAANRKTAAMLSRRALDEILAQAPKLEWDANSLKQDYLNAMAELDRPDGNLEAASAALDLMDYFPKGGWVPPHLARRIFVAWRFFVNEPEASRRVLRLAYANWLAHDQDVDANRGKPSVLATYRFRPGAFRTTSIPFFTPGPDALAGARAISPEELARKLTTARDAKWLLDQWPWWSLRMAEKRAHAHLVVLLAEELYRRDHGKPPASDQDLVGPYLKRLPDDGSDDLPDGSIPRVERTNGLE